MAYKPPRLTLTQRIFFALGTVLVFGTGVAIYIFMSLQSLTAHSEEEQRAIQAMQAAYELDIDALRVILALRQYREVKDRKFLVEMEAGRAAAAQNRADLRKYTLGAEVLEALDQYEALLPKRIAAANVILAAIELGEKDSEIAYIVGQREQLDSEAHALLRRIIAGEQREFKRVQQANLEARSTIRRNVVAAIALAILVISALLYSVVAGGLTRRLNQLTDMARKVAAGDFSKLEFVRGEDEVAILAKTFNEMAGQLAEFDKVKEEFVALASHQLRTPATAVKGNLGMLLEGYCGELTAEQQEILNDANQSNERQLTIIDDMLWVARTDSGRLELSKSPTDLSRLASEVVTEQMHTARERKQTITLENPAGELMLELDAQKIRMVFENLLSNASKYTPESGQIKVTLKQESNGAVLAVSDTGVGIAQEDIGKLFSKFSRIANPLSDKVGGTGLGLYLANEIVKLHGGAIRVDSTPGAGTTFTVTLLKVDRRRHSIHRNGVERRR